MRYLFVLLLFLIISPAFSQFAPYRVYFDSLQTKQTLYQTRESDNEEWQNVWKTIKAYNGKGYPVIFQNWRKYKKSGWRLALEEVYDYDNRDNVISYVYKWWSEETGVLGSESKYEIIYDDEDREVEIRYHREDFYNSTWYESVTFYVYDENGHRIEEMGKWTDSEYPTRGYLRKRYWSTNDCMVAVSSFDFLNNQWVPRDSISYTNDIQCQQELYEKYVSVNGAWLFHHAEKTDRMFDAHENAIEKTKYLRNDSDVDWVIDYKETWEYDPTGSNVLAYTFYRPGENYLRMEQFSYDSEGKIIYETMEEIQNYETGEIHNSSNGYYQFDENGNNIYEEHNYEYDSTFLGYYSVSKEFDFNNNVIRREINSKDIEYTWDDDNNVVENIKEENTEDINHYRCDNVSLGYTSTILYSNKQYRPTGQQSRSVHEYYLQPDCLIVESVAENFTLFPNPVRDYVHGYFPESFGNTRIRIMDEIGRVVYDNQLDLTNYFSIDLKAHKTGTYILNLENGNARISRKFILIR